MTDAPRFQRWIGIDYSGAATPETRLPGLRAAVATPGQPPSPAEAPAAGRPGRPRRRNWTRRDLAAWLTETLADGVPTVVGIDHAFGVPAEHLATCGLAGRDWDAFLDDFTDHWPADQPGATVAALRPGNRRLGPTTALRRTDAHTAGAKSVFQFDVQGTVANSTHAGLPWVRRLRRAIPPPRLHAWPFDGWAPPSGASLIAEVFPSRLRRRWPRGSRTVDEHDAWCVAAWLQDVDVRGELDVFLRPPLSGADRHLARLEGWILGVV